MPFSRFIERQSVVTASSAHIGEMPKFKPCWRARVGGGGVKIWWISSPRSYPSLCRNLRKVYFNLFVFKSQQDISITARSQFGWNWWLPKPQKLWSGFFPLPTHVCRREIEGCTNTISDHKRKKWWLCSLKDNDMLCRLGVVEGSWI